MRRLEVKNINGDGETHFIEILEGSSDIETIELYLNDEASGELVNVDCDYELQ